MGNKPTIGDKVIICDPLCVYPCYESMAAIMGVEDMGWKENENLTEKGNEGVVLANVVVRRSVDSGLVLPRPGVIEDEFYAVLDLTEKIIFIIGPAGIKKIEKTREEEGDSNE